MKFKNTANYFLVGCVLFGGASLMAQNYYEYIDFVGKDYSSSFLQGNYSNSHIISNNSYKITIETTPWDVGDGDDKETHYLEEFVYRKNGVVVKSETIQSYHWDIGETIVDYVNPDIFSPVEYSVSNKAANFEKTFISKSDFSNSVFSSTLSTSDGSPAYRYVYSKIYGAYFSRGEIADSSFYNTSFYANLNRSEQATTHGSVVAAFFGSNISDSNFEKCNFTAEASMGPEDLSPGLIGARFEDIKIENSSFSGSKFSLSSIPAYHYGVSVCVSFQDSELNNVDFSNCTFEIDAKEAKPDTQKAFIAFTNCKLNNVDLSSNKYESNVAIETPISFGYCELSNVSLDLFPVFDGPVTIENLTFKGLSLSAENISFLKSITKENARGFSMENSDLRGRDYSSADLSNIGLIFSNFEGAVLENTNLAKSDLRGSKLDGVVGKYHTHNTLMPDGTIKGFSMVSPDDSFSIMAVRGNGAALAKSAENNLSGEVYNGISAKISESDADISGGAVLSVKDGALLEVLDSRTLTLSQDGVLLFEIGDSFTGPMLFVDEGSSFVLDGGSIFVDLILDSVLEESGYSFDILRSFGNFDATSFAKGENIFLLLNGQAFFGEWGYEYSDGVLSINLSSIPETSVYAAFLGVLSLGAAICRRRS